MRLSSPATLCVLIALLAIAQPASGQDADEAPEIVVELIEPGSAPRRVVRFTPQVGDKQTAEMIIDMQQKVSLGGAPMPSQAIPPQKMTMEIQVTDITAEDNIRFEFQYTDMKVVDDPNNPSPIAETMEKMLAPMIGATGRGIVTNRGLTQQGELDIPAGLNPQIKQMLEGMKDAMNRLSSPLPIEAIGQGAKWRVIQNLEANGMKLTQTSTHEITSMTGDGFEMSVSVSQNADPQEIQNPMLPAGTTLKLDSLKSSGSGTTKIEESSIFPIASEVSINTVANMSIDVAGQNQKMQTDIQMGMKLNQVGE
ncbi:hypothetical protein [Aporhodopirellula aestuarii]|uniref:Secreted protein n=1 Tax=Aporhodopirellula aestuarii TaxID=2950107 RepID=A0ABT0UA16_9BACT|nr:hypothetical protein [Aporhodopirellula aestuarii]MCM2373360.1 hypothetical protein [Aporhodopirellula aestuarii]